MCGLFGCISSDLDARHKTVVRQLGIISQFRGTDSTGIATVSIKKKKKLQWNVHRELGDSTRFFKQTQVRELLDKSSEYLVMGHTRLTTSGETNLRNAHPICEKHITGCHNGVIHALEPKKEEKASNTDSRVLFKIIAEKGLEEAIKKAKYGSMALTYIDKQKKTFNIFKDDDRPLWLTNDKNHKTYFYASESRFLDFIIEGNCLYDWAEPYEVQPYHLYTWHIGSSKFDLTEFEKPEVIYTPYVYRSAGSSSYPLMDYSTYTMRGWESEDNHKEPLPRKSRFERFGEYAYCTVCWESEDECLCDEQAPEELPEGALDERTYVWYAGQRTPAYIIQQMLGHGCFNCQRIFKLTDRVYWPHWDYYLCEECASSEFYREALKHQPSYMGGLVN